MTALQLGYLDSAGILVLIAMLSWVVCRIAVSLFRGKP